MILLSISLELKKKLKIKIKSITAPIPIIQSIPAVKKEKGIEKKEIAKPAKTVIEKKIIKKVDEQVTLEDFYYAVHPNDIKIDIDEAISFSVEVFFSFKKDLNTNYDRFLLFIFSVQSVKKLLQKIQNS